LKTNGLNLAGPKDAGIDLDALWRRVGHDAELLRELIELLERESPGMLAQIRSAIESNDAERLRRLSHKIKGSLLQFSAHGAAAYARKLEELGGGGRVAGADELLRNLEREIELLVSSLRKFAGQSAIDGGPK
jgi:HPt (histidine-containing phosphotransfer) domain-containing protein